MKRAVKVYPGEALWVVYEHFYYPEAGALVQKEYCVVQTEVVEVNEYGWMALREAAAGLCLPREPRDRAWALLEAVQAHMQYAPGVTGVSTTAAQAYELGQGVCQDYAHILLSLLRCSGIPARYACGYLAGEGAGHAWVEFFDQGVWRGLDPANNRLLSCGCIKVAHGRDSADCPVNRGVFTGRAAQQNTLAIKVEEV